MLSISYSLKHPFHQKIIWAYSRRDPFDAHDILFILASYWEAIDINRIVEQDMNTFVHQNPEAKGAWKAIKRRYGP